MLRRRERVTQFGICAGLIPALLLVLSGCYGTMGRTKGVNERMKRPTAAYIRYGIAFDPSDNPPIIGAFVTSAGTKVRLSIEPERGADTVNWFAALRDPLTGGRIVARIENVDGVKADELGLTPQTRFAWMWVGPLSDNGTERGVAFFTLVGSNVVGPHPFRKNKVYRCADYPDEKHRPRAEIKPDHTQGDCDETTALGAARTPSRGSAQLASNALLAFDPQLASYAPKRSAAVYEPGLWISCSGGCCEVGGFTFY